MLPLATHTQTQSANVVAAAGCCESKCKQRANERAASARVSAPAATDGSSHCRMRSSEPTRERALSFVRRSTAAANSHNERQTRRRRRLRCCRIRAVTSAICSDAVARCVCRRRRLRREWLGATVADDGCGRGRAARSFSALCAIAAAAAAAAVAVAVAAAAAVATVIAIVVAIVVVAVVVAVVVVRRLWAYEQTSEREDARACRRVERRRRR